MNNNTLTKPFNQASFKQAQHIYLITKNSSNPISFYEASKMTKNQASRKIQELHMKDNEKIIKYYESQGMRAEGHELWKI